MSVSFVIEAESRSDEGKGASRRLRRQGKIPAIIYGGGEAPQSLTLDHNAMLHLLENEAAYASILTVNIDGKPSRAVLRDIQRHAFKPKLLHVDLQRVSDDDVIHMNVPLHFVGEDVAPGVKSGGLMTHNLTEIEVVCAAKDLPEFIEVDVSGMGPNSVLHLSDLQLPEGVKSAELMHGEGHDQPVVAIHSKGGAESSEEAGAEAEETGEV